MWRSAIWRSWTVKLAIESCGNKPFDNISSQELDKIITLTDSQKLPQPKWLNENRQNADNHLSIICAQEKQNKCLLKSGKQGVANSVEKTELFNNHTQIQAENESTSEDTLKPSLTKTMFTLLNK